MQGATLDIVVEWAKCKKLVNYRFHAENITHVIKILIQYTKSTNKYHVVSEEAKEKDASAPQHVDIPCTSDRIEDDDGEQEEEISYDEENK
jgi:hypothetical protein